MVAYYAYSPAPYFLPKMINPSIVKIILGHKTSKSFPCVLCTAEHSRVAAASFFCYSKRC